MVPQIGRFIRRIKILSGINSMSEAGFISAWNNSEKIPGIKSVVESLNRFISFYNKFNSIEFQNKNITPFPLFELELYKESLDRNTWDVFLSELDQREPNNLFEHIDGVLFYTPEEIPRGDFFDSIYNQSRILRNFFENTSYARTANYRNIVEKLKELIAEIKIAGTEKDKKKSLNEAIGDLKELNTKIYGLKSFRVSLSDLSGTYTYQSFHTKEAHGNLRNFGKSLRSGSDDADALIKNFQNDYYLARKKHDIASIVSVNPLRFTPLKILVIDDNKSIAEDLKEIKDFLPEETKIFLTEAKEYKKFINDARFIQKLYKCSQEEKNGEEVKLKIEEISNINENDPRNNFKEETIFEGGIFKFQYVIVDLLLGDYNEGNKIIRQLVKLRDYLGNEKASFFILTFSQSDDVDDIYRAFAEGSLGYAWKFNRVYHIPFLVGELETARRKFREGIGTTISHANARNFEKLYHLPPKAMVRLRTEDFLPFLLKNGEDKFDPLAEDVARNWIKKIPKADLHYHLGGSMDDNIIFYLAVNSLCDLLLNDGIEKKIHRLVNEFNGDGTIKSSAEEIDDFYDKFFKSENDSFYSNLIKIKSAPDGSQGGENDPGGNSSDDKESQIRKWLKQTFGRDDKIKDYIKKNIDKPAEMYFDFLASKYGISKDDIIILFIVYVGLLEGRTFEEAKSFWNDIKYRISELKIGHKIELLNFFYVEKKFKPKILNGSNFKSLKYFQKKVKPIDSQNLLRSLLLAPANAKSLAEMFRGDCFFGALHLQYYENIVACIWYLADQAVKEKNRYLEIRVSPSGYTKKGLGLEDAVGALKDGANLASLHHLMHGEFVWINFIATLKRHKTSKERVEELVSALMDDKKTSKTLENVLNKILLKEANSNSAYLPYDWRASRFVGVDLAGYESEFPPINFTEDFAPAFKLSTFVTIHAGEEAGPQFIWEAIYKLQANRIGHALTIYQAPSLMEFVRDTQTCVELCPLSNEITNFRGRSSKYPLYRYLKEGLNVTINTDDKAQTGGNINEDFVKAAEYFYLSDDNRSDDKRNKIPLTKWETLRLVKAGFDNALIPRDEKRKLLRWVEEEIYEIILRDYEIEPFYIVDK